MAKHLKRTSGEPAVSRKMRSAVSGESAPLRESGANRDRVVAVLARAKESGLTTSKGGRIAGRVSPELIERAKALTGLQSDTELLQFALANIAIEDDFARAFRELKGTVDPGLELEF